MLKWGSKLAFLLFLFLVILLFRVFFNKKRTLGSLQFSSLKVIKSLPLGVFTFLSLLPFWLKFISLIFVILALARPQMYNVQTKRNVEGVDILIALDTSSSMLIEDMPPLANRLQASKKTIEEFIQGRISDRIGLIVFSGESYTRVPLTLDYPLLLRDLKRVKTSENIKIGTAIGVALANAVARLKDVSSKSRMIIFLTDGENNSGVIDPETALEIAKGYGIKIYSIGMGRDGMAKVPFFVQTQSGTLIKKYRPMLSKVNEKLLKKMAEETGGQYYRATDLKNLKSIFKEIDHLEKAKIEVNQYVEYEELFSFYLKVAILLYCLGALLGQSLLKKGP